jgi:hypothetical protein
MPEWEGPEPLVLSALSPQLLSRIASGPIVLCKS